MSIAWTLPEERKTKISALKKGVKISEEIKAKISMAKKGSVKPEGSGRPSVNIEVVDTITQEKNCISFHFRSCPCNRIH